MYFGRYELEKKSYLLARKGYWFYRFCDTGFKDKWSGLWKGPIKFLEYYAIKIDDKWLSPETLTGFEYKNNMATHEFDLNQLKIKETVLINRGLMIRLNIENKTNIKKTSKLLFEIAANIRLKNENWHDGYSLEAKDNQLIIKNSIGSLIFKSKEKLHINGSSYYKTHYPSGEISKCFIPGSVVVDITLDPLEKKDFIFYFLLNHDGNFEVPVEEKITHLKTPIDFVNELFSTAVENLKKLASNGSVFAGYPWYTEVWGRDTMWMVQALVDLGEFERARSCLRLLARYQSNDGKIPNFIYHNGATAYNSSDSTPLWIIGLDKYVSESGDVFLLEDLRKNLQKIFNLYLGSCDERGFVKSEKFSTWCDTIERGEHCIEIQTFWYAALKSLENLFKLLNDEYQSREAKELSLKIEKNIKKEFYDGFFKDNLENSYYSANAIFPLIFGIEEGSMLQRIESDEFTGNFGVRTVSKNLSFYTPVSYHKGASWGLINGLTALAELKFNHINEGLKYLKIIHSMNNKFCLNCLPEAWNPDTGDLMLYKPEGYELAAFLLGMTSAAVVKAIDEGLLGISVDALRKTIYLKPSIKEGEYFRKKRIGSDWIDLWIKRKGNKIETNYKSAKGLKYKIIIIPKV